MPDRSPIHVPEAERLREKLELERRGYGDALKRVARERDEAAGAYGEPLQACQERSRELEARVAVAESVAEELEKKAAEAAWLGSINVASIGVSPRWLRSLAARLRGPAE